MSSDLSIYFTIPALGAVLPSLILLAVFGIFLWAALSDLRSLTIPNRLSLALCALYPAFVLSLPEAAPFVIDWQLASLAAVATLIAGICLFALGVMGGGDGKLLSMAALWVGLDGLGLMLILAAVFGGLLALIQVSTLSTVAAFALNKVGQSDAAGVMTGRRVPYAVAISTATLVVLALKMGA